MVVTKCPVTKCPVTKCPGVVKSVFCRLAVKAGAGNGGTGNGECIGDSKRGMNRGLKTGNVSGTQNGECIGDSKRGMYRGMNSS